MTRQIMTAIKGACRQKHQPLNRYVSLWGLRVIDDPSERLVEELFDQRVPDPADEVVSLEGQAAMRAALATMLSSLEVDVLRLHLDGCSYQEISDRLGRHTKAVDNALQRIKRKLDADLPASTAVQSVPSLIPVPWSRWSDSNPRPDDYKSPALPDCATPALTTR